MRGPKLISYLFGDSQVEAAYAEAQDYISEVLDAAANEKPLNAKQAPLAKALEAIGISSGGELELRPEGMCLYYADGDLYRNAVDVVSRPESMEKLADCGWVAVCSGDQNMNNEPAEYRIRFLDIATATTTDSDKGTALKAIVKAGREFVSKKADSCAENPVDHDTEPGNKQQAGMGKVKDGTGPEGKPKGAGKNESKAEKCRIKDCDGKAVFSKRPGMQGLCMTHVVSQGDREKKDGKHIAAINSIWKGTGKNPDGSPNKENESVQSKADALLASVDEGGKHPFARLRGRPKSVKDNAVAKAPGKTAKK